MQWCSHSLSVYAFYRFELNPLSGHMHTIITIRLACSDCNNTSEVTGEVANNNNMICHHSIDCQSNIFTNLCACT